LKIGIYRFGCYLYSIKTTSKNVISRSPSRVFNSCRLHYAIRNTYVYCKTKEIITIRYSRHIRRTRVVIRRVNYVLSMCLLKCPRARVLTVGNNLSTRFINFRCLTFAFRRKLRCRHNFNALNSSNG